MAKRTKIVLPKYPKISEQFNEPSLGSWSQNEPDAMNGIVRVRKYRITIDLVDEPIEVIHERIQRLWDYCDNHHHWMPIEEEAKKYNYQLQGKQGSKRTN